MSTCCEQLFDNQVTILLEIHGISVKVEGRQASGVRSSQDSAGELADEHLADGFGQIFKFL